MNNKVRYICKNAERLAIGAERAAAAGDIVAFCHLSVAAHERVVLAKQIELIEKISGPEKGSDL